MIDLVVTLIAAGSTAILCAAVVALIRFLRAAKHDGENR